MPKLVAQLVRQRRPDIEIVSLADWDGGRYWGAPDDLLLPVLQRFGLTLLTYDQKTIPPLLVRLAEAGIPHSGVIVVDQKTVPAGDAPALARAVAAFCDRYSAIDWRSAVLYLQAF